MITGKNDEFVSFDTSCRSSCETLTTSSTLRFPSREQLESLITRSGLLVRKVLGDWDARPFDPARSREIIFIAKLAQ
jgi:hypothetical protein